MSETDVKVKLVVDSNSKAATDKLKGDLQSTSTAADAHGKQMSAALGGGFKAGAVMMGNIYAKVAEKAYDIGKESFSAPIEAFMESQKQVKSLAATFALLDKGGNSMGALKMFATETKDELEQMGMKIGVSDEALVSVFNNVIERGGKSVDQAKKLTEQMALAGRIVPGGAVEISEAFENIQMGVIRARNPIVGMVASTGLLKGNAKQVAAAMQHMSPEKAMALGEQAIAKMATKMKDAPMSMKEAITSMKVMGDNLLETMGEPMTKALSKAVVGIRGLFFTPEGQATKLTTMLTEGFQSAGDLLANAFTVVQPFVDGFMEGFMKFFDETKRVWSEIFGNGQASWAQIRDIAGAVGKALGFAVNAALIAAGHVTKMMEGMVRGATLGIGVLIQGFAELVESAAQVAKALGFKEQADALFKAKRSLKEGGAQTIMFGQRTEQDKTLAQAKQTGGGDEAALRAQFMDRVKAAGVADNTEYIKQFDDAMAERSSMEANVQIADSALKMNNASAYLAAFQTASTAQDTAAMKNIANFLGNNETMATAIGQLAPDIIKGGVKSFIDALKEAGNLKMAEAIEKGQKAQLQIPKGGGGAVNMNGGQTFNIKQDFRDQDPDRVAVIFRKDLSKAASQRAESRMTRPFGF